MEFCLFKKLEFMLEFSLVCTDKKIHTVTVLIVSDVYFFQFFVLHISSGLVSISRC